MTVEQEELFKTDLFIKAVLELDENSTIQLIGGAVVDILEKRKPKDYDLIGYVSSTLLNDLGLVYQYETKTAKTKKLTLSIDKLSFDNKMLIPCDRCWTERGNAMNALHRIVHWAGKGYKISGVTYLSLLAVVGKNNNVNS